MTESIAVIFGGPSDEHDISILTGLQSSGFYLISMMLKIFIGQKTINGIWLIMP